MCKRDIRGVPNESSNLNFGFLELFFCNRVLVVRARGGARSARRGPWAQGRALFFNETSFGRCVQFRSLLKSSGACLVICMLFCNRVLVVRARAAELAPLAVGPGPRPGTPFLMRLLSGAVFNFGVL